jgi:hypothetical protein
MTDQDKVLKVVMERYGSLTELYEDMREDVDVVLVNLAYDLNDELDEDEIEDVIHKLLT